jgi:hypothetical protein
LNDKKGYHGRFPVPSTARLRSMRAMTHPGLHLVQRQSK